MSYRIEHNRPECIGCGACKQACPKHWEVKDGKSTLLKSKPLPGKEGWTYREFPNDEDIKCNESAMQACPVNVIHLIKE